MGMPGYVAAKGGGEGVDGAIMVVRPGTGEFKPQLLQADAVQRSTLNTVTPPWVIGCVCTHATICAALPDGPLPPRTPQPGRREF